jgi:hypothetical protein
MWKPTIFSLMSKPESASFSIEGRPPVVRCTQPWTIEITWYGRGDVSSVSHAHRDLEKMLQARVSRCELCYLICDTREVDGYDPSLRGPARALLSLLKQHGLKEIVIVTQDSAMRLLGAALGLAVGARVRAFESLSDARTHCSKPPE